MQSNVIIDLLWGKMNRIGPGAILYFCLSALSALRFSADAESSSAEVYSAIEWSHHLHFRFRKQYGHGPSMISR